MASDISVTRRLLKSVGVVSGLTLISRVLGLARDVVFAALFGAGAASDAFFVAFKIPNFFRRLVAEGAFAQAFVPVLTDYQHHQNSADVRLLIACTSGTLALILMAVMLLGILAAPIWIWLFAPGFHQVPEKLQLASDLLQLTFPYLPCIALVALCGSVLNTHKHFFAPAAAPVILNLTLIGAALEFADAFSQPIMVLGWAVMVAGVLQLLFQLPFMMKHDSLVWPRWGWRHPGVVRIRQLMLPAVFGVSVGQINMLLDTVLASLLVSGSVSWLYYADRLMELPLGVFGIAIATVLLPKLSQDHVNESPEQFSKTLDWGLQWVLLVGLPAATALMLLAEPVIASLFYYGAFEQTDVMQAAYALRAYGLGVLAFMLVKVLAPGYYARQDTKTPVKIAIKAMGVNMVFNLLLIWPMAHAGLALATVLAAISNAAWLWFGLVKQGVYQSAVNWWVFVTKLLMATAVMLGVTLALFPQEPVWYQGSVWQRVAQLVVWVVAGISVYAMMLWGLRVPKHLKMDK